MNNAYLFKYRRFLFWHSKKIVGHKYEETQDKMIMFFDDGSISEIAKWSNCECRLGVDWVNATKEAIRDEAGQ